MLFRSAQAGIQLSSLGRCSGRGVRRREMCAGTAEQFQEAARLQYVNPHAGYYFAFAYHLLEGILGAPPVSPYNPRSFSARSGFFQSAPARPSSSVGRAED